MTRFHGLSIVTIGAALSMTAGRLCRRQRFGRSILGALKPKPLTRGLSTGPQADAATQAKESTFVDTLRNRKTRSLSIGEREEIAEFASSKPKIDLEIHFDYNSADISKESMDRCRNSAGALERQPEGLHLRGCRSHRCDGRRDL